jgi:hypothetical protein
VNGRTNDGWGRWLSLALASPWALLILLVAGVARAQGEPRALDFSELAFGIAGNDALGLAQGDFRVLILEELGNQGFATVGANSLPSGKDAGQTAELLLGGTARDLECRAVPGACRLAIEWELRDAQRAVVVYRALTRAVVDGVNLNKPADAGSRLVLLALRSLTQRSTFREHLRRTAENSQATFVDFADPVPSFEPEYDAHKARALAEQRAREELELQQRMASSARAAREKEQAERIAAATPGYVNVMKWAGAGLMVAGGIATIATYSAFDQHKTTEGEFDRLRLGNDLGWLAMGLGAATVGLSFALRPAQPPQKSASRRTLAVALKPGQLQVRWCF